MKLKYLFASLLVGAFAFASCQDEVEIEKLGDFQAEPSYVNIPVGSTTATTAVTSTASWSVTSAPEWLTVSPTSGNGDATVTFTATEAESSREGEVVFAIGSEEAIVTVYQTAATTEVSYMSVAEGLNVPDGKMAYVEGYVTGIYNTMYGNWYLTDNNGNKIQIYGTRNQEGNTSDKTFNTLGTGANQWNLAEGDAVKVHGPVTTYGGVKEMVDVYVDELVKSLLGTDGNTTFNVEAEDTTVSVHLLVKDGTLSVKSNDEWLGVGSLGSGDKDSTFVTINVAKNTNPGTRTGSVSFIATKGSDQSTVNVNVNQKGFAVETTVSDAVKLSDKTAVLISNAIVAAKSTKGFIATDGTTAVYVFGNTKPAVGDKVTFSGTKTTYNNMPEIESVTELSVVSSGNTVSYPIVKSITNGFDKYSSKTAEYVSFSGTLAVSGKYYNVTVDGATLIGSISYPTEDLNVASLDGKVVTVTGYFNGISSGMYVNIIATKVEEGVVAPPTKGLFVDPYTPSEVIALGADALPSGEVFVKGTVVKVDEISAKYGNAQYWISDDGTDNGKLVEIYRGNYFNGAKFTEADANAIEAGDVVVVSGKLTTYKGTVGLAAGSKVHDLEAGKGTAEDPYTASRAVSLYNAGKSLKGVYVMGTIYKIDNVNTKYGNAQFWISDDGASENSTQLEAYRSLYFGSAKYTSEDQIAVGDKVVLCGDVTDYKGTVGLAANNYLVSKNGATE